MDATSTTALARTPWNKGKIIGQKAPLKPKDIWSIRVRLQMQHRTKELALFNLGFDSKLRGCDLVGLRVRDVYHGSQLANRARSLRQRARASRCGFDRLACGQTTISSRAEFTGRPTSEPDSTLGFCMAG